MRDIYRYAVRRRHACYARLRYFDAVASAMNYTTPFHADTATHALFSLRFRVALPLCCYQMLLAAFTRC